MPSGQDKREAVGGDFRFFRRGPVAIYRRALPDESMVGAAHRGRNRPCRHHLYPFQES